MRYSVASRLTALVMIAGSVLGVAAPAFAAPATPVNLAIVGGKYTNDTTPTFTWTPAEGATWYEYLLDNGNWQGIGNVSTYTLSALPNGWHTFYVRSHDNVNGVSVSTSVTFEIDTQGPSVSVVSPLVARTQVPVTFTVVAGSGDVAAMYCGLYIHGKGAFDMTAQNSSDARARTFTRTYTFIDTRTTAEVYAKCKDGDGNWTTGPKSTVSITTGGAIPSTPVSSVAPGSLVYSSCNGYKPVGASCHTVYYYGTDKTLHAFPNESIFYSWYSSFAGLINLGPNKLYSMKVGDDVTYRPGTSLVKFASSTTVYAVDVNQTLRPIMNEAAAKAIYGTRWNSYVVTIPASQRNDYKIGSKIYSSADYSKSRAYNAVKTIDANWNVVMEM